MPVTTFPGSAAGSRAVGWVCHEELTQLLRLQRAVSTGCSGWDGLAGKVGRQKGKRTVRHRDGAYTTMLANGMLCQGRWLSYASLICLNLWVEPYSVPVYFWKLAFEPIVPHSTSTSQVPPPQTISLSNGCKIKKKKTMQKKSITVLIYWRKCHHRLIAWNPPFPLVTLLLVVVISRKCRRQRCG